MKKICNILLSVLLMITMVGCGTQINEKEQEKPKSAKEMMEEASEKLQSVESVDLSMQMEMNIELNGERITMQMYGEIQIQDQGKETMKIAMPMTMEIPSQGITMEMKVYYVDGYYYMDVMGAKMKTPMDFKEMMDSVEGSTGASSVQADKMLSLGMEKREDSYVISFVGDPEKMMEYTQDVMESIQSISGLTANNMTLNDLKGTMLIDKKGNVKEQVVDMAMSMDVEGESSTTTIKTVVTYNSINEAVQIAFPDLSEYEEISLLE